MQGFASRTKAQVWAYIKQSTGKSWEPFCAGAFVVLAGILYLATMGTGYNNWGGDSSQYILHARNIALGRPYGQTGYIYCPYNPSLGPSVYPPGFPILLSPVYRLFGFSLAAFKIEEIVFLLLSLVVLWLQFRPCLSVGYRMALLGLFAFSPWIVSFKDNILSDIPFLFFTYLSFLSIALAYERSIFTAGVGLLITVLVSFSSLVRTPGVLLVPALLAYDIYRKKRLSAFSILVALASSTLILASSQCLVSGEGRYVDQMAQWSFATVLSNLIDYAKELTYFWPQIAFLPYSNVPLFLLVSVLAFIGFAVSRRCLSIVEFFLIPYLGMILVWPSRQGIRFLLPFIPLYLTYALVGVRTVTRLLYGMRAQVLFLGGLGAVVLVYYGFGLQATLAQLDLAPDGPFAEQAANLFTYVREHTEPDDVFVFRRPRILSLFTGRSATVHPNLDDDASLAYLTDVGVTYVIVDTEDSNDEALAAFLARNEIAFYSVFENARFQVHAFDVGRLSEPLAVDSAGGTSSSLIESSDELFPIGSMGVGDKPSFPEIAAKGLNVVYEFRDIQEVSEAEDYLRQAKAVGLGVIQNMPSRRAHESDDPLCTEFGADVLPACPTGPGE